MEYKDVPTGSVIQYEKRYFLKGEGRYCYEVVFSTGYGLALARGWFNENFLVEVLVNV